MPICRTTQWACFGQRPRWISAVTGGFRWRWFGECVAWVLPIFLASLLLDVVLGGLPELQVNPATGFMIAAILAGPRRRRRPARSTCRVGWGSVPSRPGCRGWPAWR